MSVPKCICRCPNPQCDGISKWSLREVTRLDYAMRVGPPDGLSALIGKGTSMEKRPPAHTVRRQLSSGTKVACTLILRLPGLWDCEK